MKSLMLYLLQVAICHTVFYLLYRALYSNLSYFNFSRIYLLSATVISFIIPILSIGVWQPSDHAVGSSLSFLALISQGGVTAVTSETTDVALSHYDFVDLLFLVLLTIYVIGCLFVSYKLLRSLWKIHMLIKNNEIVREEDYRIVRLKNGPAFFSFMTCIFINENKNSLKQDEYNTVLLHEQAHIRQKHSYDLLLMEIAGIVCWFNPFLKKLKTSLCQVHEYLADKAVMNTKHDPDAYSKLIIRLSHHYEAERFGHPFSVADLKRRINMLYIKKQSKMKAVRFVAIIPLLALLMMAFSFTERSEQGQQQPNVPQQKLIVAGINWEGNRVFTDEYLTDILAIRPGDIYNKKQLEGNLSFNPKRQDISGLYMDLGYIYFRLDPEEVVTDNQVVLNMKIQEGDVAYFNDIIIKGNSSIATTQILKMIEFEKGDKFSRSKLIQSQENLKESKLFKADKVNLNIQPQEDQSKVNIEFTVEEK
jgi:beta-lactamase regulating signal transducer with metallopeptidase domain